ncbi:MAG: TonB-dependent receptor [Pseudomonadota bacterium]
MRISSKKIVACVAFALCAPQAVWAEIGALPEVTVSSTTIDDRFDSKRGEPSNVNNISGKKVDDRHGQNIVDVLQSIPGVSAEVQSGDSVKIMLRGVEAQRYMGEKPGVAIVIDGVPVVERTGRVNIDLDNIDSIKVIKGGASYLFGEDALSGAVIITTKRGAKMAGYTASAEVGSFNTYKGILRAGFSEGKWVGHIQKSKLQSKSFYDQGDWGRDYVDGKLQYMVDESSDLTFGFEHSKRNKDSHGTVTGVTAALRDPRSVDSGKDYARKYDVTLDKANLSYAKDTGDGGNLLVNTYLFKDHTYGWQNPSGFLRTSSGAFLYGTSAASDMKLFRDAYVSGRDTQQKQSGVKSEYRQGGEQVGWMGGLDLQRFEDRALTTNLVNYTSRSTAVGASNPLNLAGAVTEDSLSTSNTRAMYGELKWQLTAPLTATFNARYDSIAAKYQSYQALTAAQIAEGRSSSGEKTFNVWSERVGVNYAFSDERELYSNLSTGFRVPTLSQLYGGTISPTGSVAPNPNLKPEKSYNAEVGLRAKSELFGIALDTDVAVFQIDRKDFILNTGGQYQSTPGATLTNALEQYQNIGGVRNRGLEAALKTDAREVWSGELAYTYLNAIFTRNDVYWMSMGTRGSLPSVKYNNTGNVVPRTPKHHINMTTRYRPADGWTLTGELDAQSGIYADEVNVVWVGGRTVYNVMANYEFKSDRRMKWSAFARIDNLFNRYYYSTIRGGSDGNGDGVYNAEDVSISVNPGRVWTVGASLSF